MNFDEDSRLHEHGGSSGDAWGRLRTRLEKRLACALGLALALAFALALALIARASKGRSTHLKEDDNVCLSTSCISSAARLRRSMDQRADPCLDFHAFACGAWGEDAPLEGQIITHFTRTQHKLTLRIKEILESKRTNLSEHEKKTNDFFNTCMELGDGDSNWKEELKSDLEKFGRWPLLQEKWDPTVDWTALMDSLFQAGYPVNMLMSLSVDRNVHNTSSSVILVDQPTLGLGSRVPYFLETDAALERYRSLIVRVAHSLAPTLKNETDLKEQVDAAIGIEKLLARVVEDKLDKNTPEKYYNMKTLTDMEKEYPNIPWRGLLKQWLPGETTLRDGAPFMVTQPTVFNTLDGILSDKKDNTG